MASKLNYLMTMPLSRRAAMNAFKPGPFGRATKCTLAANTSPSPARRPFEFAKRLTCSRFQFIIIGGKSNETSLREPCWGRYSILQSRTPRPGQTTKRMVLVEDNGPIHTLARSAGRP